MLGRYVGFPRQQDPELAALFQQADVDQDGRISKPEFQALLGTAVAEPEPVAPDAAAALQAQMLRFKQGFGLLKRQTLLAARVLFHARQRQRELEGRQKALVAQAGRDCAKLLPFLVLSCLPGGWVLAAGLATLAPRCLPSAFVRGDLDGFLHETAKSLVGSARSAHASRGLARSALDAALAGSGPALSRSVCELRVLAALTHDEARVLAEALGKEPTREALRGLAGEGQLLAAVRALAPAARHQVRALSSAASGS